MNKLDEQYRGILAELLHNGNDKEDRTGTGTLSKFGMQIRHDMKDGFPLLTTKRMAVKTMMTELKWFLKGDTNIKYLVDNNCNIWNGDAYKNFLIKSVPHDHQETKEEFINKIKTDNEFATKWGELGPIYGKQWRRWVEESEHIDGVSYMMYNGIDQIKNLINELKTNPDSRRLMVSAWNVGELSEMTLPPCHYGFQVYTRLTTREEKIVNPGKYRAISLMWNQRSVDTFLGLPFNIASYATLLCLIAEEVNMIPDQLIGNLGDVHLYKNHVEQAREQISRDGFDLPTIKLSNVDILNGEFKYQLINYHFNPSIKAPLSN
ncbi:thymidylate synthase [bacterium]|nr:thymidylate synthase [bacterium]MDB9900143.1 thymidylate synthase [bacterium]